MVVKHTPASQLDARPAWVQSVSSWARICYLHIQMRGPGLAEFGVGGNVIGGGALA